MDRLNSIVVAVDFTPGAASALAQAVRMSAWNRAKLHVVHIIETLVVLELTEAMTPFVKEIEQGLIDDAKKLWAGFANDVPGKSGLDFAVAVNNPLVEITRRVHDRNADLLVMGAHGVAPDRGAGILATQCVRKVPTRVMLVRDKHTGPFKSVVACVDFSETSRAALDAAIRIVAQDNATLHVLHVYQPSWKRLMARSAPAGFEAQFKETLMNQLTAFCAPKSPEVAWVKPKYSVVEASSHGAGITEFVKSSGADLVVLGTRGKTNLRDVVMGSTAERVVRDSTCSILAIKPQ